MRDPELVFRAQLAASALERAWQRWRVMHGLVADPAPAISSYVGYSLEDPWGQPRVVFGLSADDAEQLAALLDRHDCVGPVHAKVTARPADREIAAGRDTPAGREAAPGRQRPDAPLPVPPQAPPAGAKESVPVRPGSPRPAEGMPGARAGRSADDLDGPVFRQVAAAAREAAAARGGSGPARRRERPEVPPALAMVSRNRERASGRPAVSRSEPAGGRPMGWLQTGHPARPPRNVVPGQARTPSSARTAGRRRPAELAQRVSWLAGQRSLWPGRAPRARRTLVTRSPVS